MAFGKSGKTGSWRLMAGGLAACAALVFVPANAPAPDRERGDQPEKIVRVEREGERGDAPREREGDRGPRVEVEGKWSSDESYQLARKAAEMKAQGNVDAARELMAKAEAAELRARQRRAGGGEGGDRPEARRNMPPHERAGFISDQAFELAQQAERLAKAGQKEQSRQLMIRAKEMELAARNRTEAAKEGDRERERPAEGALVGLPAGGREGALIGDRERRDAPEGERALRVEIVELRQNVRQLQQQVEELTQLVRQLAASQRER